MKQGEPPAGYGPPVDALLRLGPPGGDADEPLFATPFDDYTAMGLTKDHAPELWRMVRDEELVGTSEDEPESFAPIHAVRAIAALGCEEYIPGIIKMAEKLDKLDADWWLEDIPEILVAFGPAALGPALAAYRDQRVSFGARLFLGHAVERIARKHPEHRTRVVSVLMDMLRYARTTDVGINGHAIAMLTALSAVEALPSIRAAFDTGRVDLMHTGKREDVERLIHMTFEEQEADHRAEAEKVLQRYEASGGRDVPFSHHDTL